MDKVTDFLTFRMPPGLKADYDRLDAAQKKTVKMKVLHTIARVCFSELHFDPLIYGLDDYKVDDE